jgi:hypothetical protein
MWRDSAILSSCWKCCERQPCTEQVCVANIRLLIGGTIELHKISIFMFPSPCSRLLNLSSFWSIPTCHTHTHVYIYIIIQYHTLPVYIMYTTMYVMYIFISYLHTTFKWLQSLFSSLFQGLLQVSDLDLPGGPAPPTAGRPWRSNLDRRRSATNFPFKKGYQKAATESTEFELTLPMMPMALSPQFPFRMGVKESPSQTFRAIPGIWMAMLDQFQTTKNWKKCNLRFPRHMGESGGPPFSVFQRSRCWSWLSNLATSKDGCDQWCAWQNRGP